MGTVQALAAETAKDTWLTLDRIFDSDEFDSEDFGPFQWRQRHPGFTTLEKAEGTQPGKDLVWHDPATGRKEILVQAHHFIPPRGSAPLPIEDYAFSDNGSKLLIFTNSKRVWRRHTRGDYWVLDLTSLELTQLGAGTQPASLQFAKFSPDGTRVAYLHNHNLYVQTLIDGQVRPLTTNGSATLINGTFDWVYEEELDLRDGFRWSPDGQFIAYWQLDSSAVKDFFLINDTDGLYPRLTAIPYPMTGEQNSAARIGVINAQGGETHWLDVPGDPRNHYLARMDWANNSEQIILQQFNRLQNTNRLMLADAKTGRVRILLTETDRAWVENANDLHWIKSGQQFVWLSERQGWRQAHRVSRSGKIIAPITPGDFDVIHIEAIDEKNGWLYYLASPDRPTQRYLYRSRLYSRGTERLTPPNQPGTHHYHISPEAKWAVHTYSTFDRPPRTDLISLPAHQPIRELAGNHKLREKLKCLNKPLTEFFRININQNVLLDAWCLKPPHFNPANKYPALFYVYGEPAGQTVLDAWPGKRQLWHWMLAQQGYLVLSVDNRGTPAPRGRDWRKCIYRHVGVLASADQAAATQAILKQRPYVDAHRIAIWGWSGGGSMTLNAIFRYPDLYQTAMAVAPVPNLRFYDTIYQERYLGLPNDNVEGYRKGSPITYADQLKGHLLLVHGTGDDNCHYQGTEALINQLVAHNKPFSMMAYPNRTHSISEGKNTTRHLYGLLTQFLHEQTPVGPKPSSPPAQPPGAADDSEDEE